MTSVEEIVDCLLTFVSGKKAWDVVERLSLYHRIQGSPMYKDAVDFLQEELSKLNPDELTVHSYPADGEKQYLGWTMPLSWEITSAELWVTQPTKYKLSDFEELPVSVVTYSKGAEVEAELVDVGRGEQLEDFKGVDVSGKIILMSGSPRKNIDLIHKLGALGVVIYPNNPKTAAYPDLVRYDGIWPESSNIDISKWGFSISFNQATHLKSLLTKGVVKLSASIRAKVQPGEIHVLTTAIKGTKPELPELVLIAHLCHPSPSANDNASGSAGLYEAFRSLKQAIDAGLIQPLENTIRFVWVPEFSGTVPWLQETLSGGKRFLAGINFDMIGEHPLKIGYPLEVVNSPYSTPSVLNDVVCHITKIVADHKKGLATNGTQVPMNYRFTPCAGGSDHQIFTDSQVRVPFIHLSHDDMFHHTSYDTIDKVDPTELQRTITIGLASVVALAYPKSDITPSLWETWVEGSRRRRAALVTILGNFNHSIELEEIPQNQRLGLGQEMVKVLAGYELEILTSLLSSNEGYNLLWDSSVDDINTTSKTLLSYLTSFINQSQLGGTTDETSPPTWNNLYVRKYDGVSNYSMLSLLDKNEVYDRIKERLPPYVAIGFVLELLNLVGHGKPLVEISALLTLHFNLLVTPSMVEKLIETLKNKDLVSKLA